MVTIAISARGDQLRKLKSQQPGRKPMRPVTESAALVAFALLTREAVLEPPRVACNHTMKE
jgi:hypothetical protein